jgi:hypothetical protein
MFGQRGLVPESEVHFCSGIVGDLESTVPELLWLDKSDAL